MSRSILILGFLVAAFRADAGGPASGPARPVEFDRDVRPLLARHCQACHGPSKQKGGLRLDLKSAAFKGGDSGPAIVTGKAAESLIVQLASGQEEDRVMPPKGAAAGPRRARDAPGLDRPGRLVGRARRSRRRPRLVVAAAALPPCRARARPRRRPRRPQPDRCVRPGEAAGEGAGAVARGRPADADPPALLRPDRPAADARGGRRVRRRPGPRRLREAGRPPARPARTTASAGPGTGSTSSTTATRTATTRTSRGPTPGPTATTSSARSTPTSRTAEFVQEQIAGDVLFPGTDRRHRRRSASSPPARGTSSATPRCRRRRSTARSPATSTATTWSSNTINTFISLTVQCAQCHNHKFDPIRRKTTTASRPSSPRSTGPTGPTTPTRRSARKSAELKARARCACKQRAASSEAAVAEGRRRAAAPSSTAKIAAAGQPTAAPAEFGYHSAHRAEAGRDEMGAGRPGPTVARSTGSCSGGCHDDFNNIGAGFGFPRPVQGRSLGRPDVPRRASSLIVDRTRARRGQPRASPRRPFPAGGVDGPLRPRDGHEAGPAAERLHLRPGRAGGARRGRRRTSPRARP